MQFDEYSKLLLYLCLGIGIGFKNGKRDERDDLGHDRPYIQPVE